MKQNFRNPRKQTKLSFISGEILQTFFCVKENFKQCFGSSFSEDTADGAVVDWRKLNLKIVS